METPTPGHDTFQRFEIMLVRSGHCGWTELRLTLDALPFVAVVGATADPHHALQLAASLQPQLIISAERFGHDAAIPHLKAIQARSPNCRFLIIAAELQPQDVEEMAMFGITSCLLWRDLSAPVIRHVANALLIENLIVVSRDVAAAFVAAQAFHSSIAHSALALTERERRILQHLADGVTHDQIARLEGMSLRTVERLITHLETELDAPGLFVLGRKAQQLGLLE